MPRGQSQCVYGLVECIYDIIGKLNLERYRRTQDREYHRDVVKLILVDLANRHWMIYDHLWLMWIRIMLMYGTLMIQNHLDTMLVFLMILTLWVMTQIVRIRVSMIWNHQHIKKHVESRGAYALRGSGPPKTARK